jgi:pilus assembly protein FimV
MSRDKSRTEIPLKLLEIYHARKSATAFENVARELKETVGEGSPAWAKACRMGAQIDPTNPLYAGADAAAAPAPEPAAHAAKPDLDFDINAPTSSPRRSRASTSTSTARRPAAPLRLRIPAGLDFDIAPLDAFGHRRASATEGRAGSVVRLRPLGLSTWARASPRPSPRRPR